MMKKSRIEFGSLLSYLSHNRSNKEALIAYNKMLQVKKNETSESGISTAESIAHNIKEKLNDYPFNDYFDQNTALIPTPKHSLHKKDTLWPARCITLALEGVGLGKNVECLERYKAVPKSATSRPSDRPKALKHYNSMRVKELVYEPEEIVIVDDVITKGATTLGAANRIADVFPSANIRVFAVVRTMNESSFLKIEDPTVGEINLRNDGWTIRKP